MSSLAHHHIDQWVSACVNRGSVLFDADAVIEFKSLLISVQWWQCSITAIEANGFGGVTLWGYSRKSKFQIATNRHGKISIVTNYPR